MRIALFRCTRSGKVLYCGEVENRIEMGSGFPPSNVVASDDIIKWLDTNNCIVDMPYDGGAVFDNFVQTHKRTMKREA